MSTLSNLQSQLANYLALDIPKTIKTNKDYKLAADAVKFLTDREKFAEAYRKESIAEFEEPIRAWRAINAEVKKQIEPISLLKEKVKQLMLQYNLKKQQDQAAYEQTQKLANPDKSELVVDDKVAKLKESEFSTNSFKSVTKYRIIDIKLKDCVEIKQNILKEYLKNNPLPIWLEEYEEQSVIVRTK